MNVLGGMPVAKFLRDYWQKKPLLVRGAFPGFRDPISPDELAGLACEDGVESRIVREKGKTPWEVTWGPHEESRFTKLPERGWTVLVQEVNRWVPEAALLLDCFAFIPNVRVDDVMVSYAVPGGNVGPHLDSYDVFLVQGQGKRRWKFHTKPTKDVELVPDLDLRVLARFRPDVDEVLEPGDMLYLPPGFAHHGVAVTPCLTYSIRLSLAECRRGMGLVRARCEGTSGGLAPARRSSALGVRAPGRDPAERCSLALAR